MAMKRLCGEIRQNAARLIHGWQKAYVKPSNNNYPLYT